jgi:two-component system sensor histidine kinase QseC
LLTVEDQGPGIAPALRQRVFDRFFRDPAQVQSGSGLGLAIAQAAAARHGGRIALLDGEGGGLLVQVALPLAGRV